MKKTLTILSLISLTACHSISITTPDGSKASVKSFGQKTTISEMTYDASKGVKLKGYNNNQVDALGIIAEGVAKGTAEGLTGKK